ncbi:protein-tyrosine phosphatase-like protein [Boletus reticuloceps]|uniref:protein-tyrosine-phosphatase n=1 Tax=Boletus reticuloceps TaxID=495285 RepID=A0A8I2YLB7_9AGAM|nr:protein-tyrosine phosphatase-like protein [Boletus reticuloceps]
MTWSAAPISINAVIDDKLYIGKYAPPTALPFTQSYFQLSLSAALSQDVQKKLGITHLLSVCVEHTFDPQPNTMVVPVQDSEYEDLLIHLPGACLFIETALSRGGKVLVHCVMGISRSATVICAYRECSRQSLVICRVSTLPLLFQVMVSQRLSVSAAIQYVRKSRPEIHPNYGFVRQLHAFAKCRYRPSWTNSEYIAWKRRQKREVTKYLNLLTDCIPVIPDQLYLTSEFPGDPDAAEALLLDLGVTHLLSISSAQLPKPNIPSIYQHCFIDVPNSAREALLLELSHVCTFIGDAIARGGQVLVQCRVELRACIVVCAYLMASRNISPRQAFTILEAALPLYNPTTAFYRHLDIFAACNFHPTVDHPIVHAWLAEQSSGPLLKLATKTQSITTNPPSLTITTSTTLSNCVPSRPLDAFDLASLNEVLLRYQSTSEMVS